MYLSSSPPIPPSLHNPRISPTTHYSPVTPWPLYSLIRLERGGVVRTCGITAWGALWGWNRAGSRYSCQPLLMRVLSFPHSPPGENKEKQTSLYKRFYVITGINEYRKIIIYYVYMWLVHMGTRLVREEHWNLSVVATLLWLLGLKKAILFSFISAK